MQEWIIMFVPLGYAQEFTISNKTAEFHTRDEIVPFLENEFVFYCRKGWNTVVIGVVEVVGDEV